MKIKKVRVLIDKDEYEKKARMFNKDIDAIEIMKHSDPLLHRNFKNFKRRL